MTQIDDIAPLITLITAERIGGDSPLFEDARQEAMLAAWQRLEEGHPKGIAIYKARQAVIDVARGRRMTGSKHVHGGTTDAAQHSSSLYRQSADGSEEYVLEPADHQSLVEMARIDAQETLREALGALTEAERALIHLRFYRGLTQAEIASLEGVTSQAISARLRKTLAKLRESLS